MNKLEFFLIVFILINIVTFFVYYADKRKAQRGEWRISEASLLLLAFFGGAIGAFFSMIIFHHKTRKLKFRLLVPFFMIIQLVLIIGTLRLVP